MVDATRIPDQLRENIWRGQVDAYRLQQYYGRLAGVRTRNVSIVMTLGCLVAFVGPHLDALGAPSSLEILVSLVGVVVAIGTIAQGHNRIVEALFRHQQFADLHVEWTDLWQGVEDRMTRPGEARTRWKELALKAYAITARAAQDRVNERLLDTTEQAAYAYYGQEAAAGVPAAS